MAVRSIAHFIKHKGVVLPEGAGRDRQGPLDIRGIDDATLLAPAGTLCPKSILAAEDERFQGLKIKIR